MVNQALTLNWHYNKKNSRICLYNIISCYLDGCGNDCNGHGDCKNGRCNCDPGFDGENCTESKFKELLTKFLKKIKRLSISDSVCPKDLLFEYWSLIINRTPTDLDKTGVMFRTKFNSFSIYVYIHSLVYPNSRGVYSLEIVSPIPPPRILAMFDVQFSFFPQIFENLSWK